MKTAMHQMLDELMAHEYTIPIQLIVKCKELIEVEKEQIEQAYMHGLAWMMPEGSERVTIVKSKWDI
jgi:hypothetical protein